MAVDIEALTLGQLIDRLETANEKLFVTFDFCQLVPDDLMSYRGYYSELAFDYRESPAKTVKELLLQCRVALRQSTKFQGYKGGEYQMDRNTKLYVADYGRASSTVICGVEIDEEEVVLLTGREP